MMKMKKLKKRLFSAALACLTAASMLPLTAMAATATTTDAYTGRLYHIDIVVEGSFTYTADSGNTEETPITTITKVWDDKGEEVDHSEDTVTVYLLDENGDRITDDDSNDETVTLNAENKWTVNLNRNDVYSVEEMTVDGYETKYGDGYSTSTEDASNYVTTVTATVTSVNSVYYLDSASTSETAPEEATEISASYYEKKTDTNRGDLEFFCGDYSNTNSNLNLYVRRLGEENTYTDSNGTTHEALGQLTTSGTIWINVTYEYSYKDENGNTKTGTNTETFRFNAGENNACGEAVSTVEGNPPSDKTEVGYDAVITASMIGESVTKEILTRTVTITNTLSTDSSGGSDDEGSKPEDEEEEEIPEEPDDDDDDDDTTDTTPTVTEETTETETTTTETTTTTTETTTTETTTTATASACLAIIKEDAETGAYLEGAIYALYSAYDDSLIGYYKTNEEGWLSTYPMSSGTYYFIETQAPEGYVLDETPVYVTLDASSGETLVTIVTNTAEEGEVLSEAVEPTEPDEPDDPDDGVVLGESRGAGTGDDSNLLLWLILMLAAGAGIGGVVLTTRRNHA